MGKKLICALCEEEIPEDEEYTLGDGRVVCEYCHEYNCVACDECGEEYPEEELEYWGDDMRLCPECFKQYFPDFDPVQNREDTREAYEAMCRRLIGKKTDNEPDVYYIETEMDDDSFRYSIEVTVNEEGRISDISRYSVSRCQSIGITSETWHDYPVDPKDYSEDGMAEDLIRGELDILDDEDEEAEEEEENEGGEE